MGSPARAASDESCLTVHAGPEITDGKAASYFDLAGEPGQVLHRSVVLANPEAIACDVDVVAAYGKTATNSGNTYPTPPGDACIATSCWLSGLPATARVPAGGRMLVPFAVAIPPDAAPGQYLAGILSRPTRPPSVPDAGQRGVGAVILTSVGLGVAVTVAGPLSPALEIPSVTLDLGGAVPVLHIVEHNVGNTWEHPAGGAEITTASGEARRFGVESSTVLPGDTATLSVPLTDIDRGSRPTRVVLSYAQGTRTAVWTGTLDFPRAAPARAAPPDDARTPTGNRTPTWIIVGAAGFGLVMLVHSCVVFFILGRRRRRRDDESEPRPEAAAGTSASGGPPAHHP